MKHLAAVALIMVVYGSVRADEVRIADQKESKKGMLVADEKVAERLRREKDRKEHMKYLLEITRSR